MTDLYYDKKYVAGLSERFNPLTYLESKDHTSSELEMHERINALNPKLVIDAGCGYNEHKNKIQNLIGFDPSPFPNIDFQSTILDAEFESNCADAVLALGSIHFINYDYICENFARIYSWCKPGGLIEMRVNPTEYHHPEHLNTRFAWQPDMIQEFTEKYNLNFMVTPKPVGHKICKKTSKRNHASIYSLRIKWTWIK